MSHSTPPVRLAPPAAVLVAVWYLVVLSGAARAQPIDGHAPWCALMGDSFQLDCGYYSLQQCMARASGVTNQCTPNSWYVPQGPRGRSKKRSERR